MPYVNVKISRDGATPVQRAKLISGLADLFADVLNTDPSTTHVVIDEVEMDDWRLGGLPIEEFRRLIEDPHPLPPNSMSTDE